MIMLNDIFHDQVSLTFQLLVVDVDRSEVGKMLVRGPHH